MDTITEDMKVSEIIQRWPESVDVFLSYRCPDMRHGFFKLMAKIMSVKNAARIHRISLDKLLDDLNKCT